MPKSAGRHESDIIILTVTAMEVKILEIMKKSLSG